MISLYGGAVCGRDLLPFPKMVDDLVDPTAFIEGAEVVRGCDDVNLEIRLFGRLGDCGIFLSFPGANIPLGATTMLCVEVSKAVERLKNTLIRPAVPALVMLEDEADAMC